VIFDLNHSQSKLEKSLDRAALFIYPDSIGNNFNQIDRLQSLNIAPILTGQFGCVLTTTTDYFVYWKKGGAKITT
jgi:hypothetical protein